MYICRLRLFRYYSYLRIATVLTVSLFIFSTHFWYLYFFYEVSIIPILLIILGGGANPYRFNAAYFILVYSLLVSLPSLVILTILIKLNMTLTIRIKRFYSLRIRSNFLLMIFFVKTPIYTLHYWLPKAHVEASTLGSVILARFILKLGALGCLKLISWLNLNYFNNITFLIIRLCIISIKCILQSDLKKLIALTSVLHITMGLIIVSRVNLNTKIFIVINITHSINSALIFYFSGVISKISSSRMIYLQNFLKFNLGWGAIALLVTLNLGVPPFYTFLGELITFSVILVNNFSFIVIRLLVILMVTLYSLILLNNFQFYNSIKVNFICFIFFLIIRILSFILWFIKWV